MKPINKLSVYILFLACIGLTGYFLWLLLQPVDIVAVHYRSNNYSDILVKNFPFTDKGKISWWLKNKQRIRRDFRIPIAAKDGSYHITFWLFGKGYKAEEKYDRLCFEDIKTKANCIEKNAVFTVSQSKNRGTIFTVYDGEYRLEEDGTPVKIQKQVNEHLK